MLILSLSRNKTFNLKKNWTNVKKAVVDIFSAKRNHLGQLESTAELS
jgi:hypothetical protein